MNLNYSVFEGIEFFKPFAQPILANIIYYFFILCASLALASMWWKIPMCKFYTLVEIIDTFGKIISKMKQLLPLILLLVLSFQTFAQVDFRRETIYFLITSRFFDGDSTNNAPTEWCSYISGVNNPNITDPHDVTWRGDFKGLIQKLDYIKGMGFTAIWITPVVENRSPLD